MQKVDVQRILHGQPDSQVDKKNGGPVTHRRADGSRTWSKFMNRYAISPIPPLAQKGTDGAGIVYTNSWNIDIPYSGFHAMKGTVDNGGRVLVDGQVILQGGYFSGAKFAGSRTLEGFSSVSPKFKKFYLEEGKHTITVEVENRDHSTKKIVEKKSLLLKIGLNQLRKVLQNQQNSQLSIED